jgi:hypothetical protein
MANVYTMIYSRNRRWFGWLVYTVVDSFHIGIKIGAYRFERRFQMRDVLVRVLLFCVTKIQV